MSDKLKHRDDKEYFIRPSTEEERLSIERISEEKGAVVRKTHALADQQYDNQEYAAAFLMYSAVVEHDLSGFSLYRLACMHQEGLGVERPDKEYAQYLFSQAWPRLTSPSNADDPYARFALGAMCELSYHPDALKTDAAMHYAAAAALGHVGSQYILGCLYRTGGGGMVSTDFSKAQALFEQATEQGHLEASVQLGYMYFMGEAGKHNKEEALKLFKAAVDKNHPQAQFHLATMYYYGRGVEADQQKAILLYRLSASQGNPLAMTELAWLYDQGKVLPQNKKKALKYYRRAAEKNHVEAIYHLAIMMKNGEGIAAPDLDEAERLFDLAAQLGHTRARTHSLRVSQKREKKVKKEIRGMKTVEEEALEVRLAEV